MEHSVTIERPIRELSPTLVDAPATWFPRLKRENTTSIGLRMAGIPLRKKVIVEFGEPARMSTWAVIPVRWEATFPEALFPSMTGKVAISAASKNRTKLTVSGVYEPPLGRFGEGLNEALMRSVATRTVKELAEQIAKRLAKIAKAAS